MLQKNKLLPTFLYFLLLIFIGYKKRLSLPFHKFVLLYISLLLLWMISGNLYKKLILQREVLLQKGKFKIFILLRWPILLATIFGIVQLGLLTSIELIIVFILQLLISLIFITK